MLTVFAGEPQPPRRSYWDVWCGFESSAESVPARRREDERALAGTPHRSSRLDLLEAQYLRRGRPGRDARVVAEALERWLDDTGGGTVALPAGAGHRVGRPRAWLAARLGPRFLPRLPGPPQHPDHLFVRDVGLDTLVRSGAAVLLYEELPYLWGAPADGAAGRAAAGFGTSAEPLILAVDRERKAARIAAYESQVPRLSPPGRGRLDDPAELPEVERYWLLSQR